MLVPRPPPPDRSGERIRGKYQLDSRIAVGGMGEVYRATNTLVGREVAIKILLPSLAQSENVRARFLREAQMAHFVRHAHVVEILDIDEDERGFPFIVQELLEGEDLGAYIDRSGGRLSLEVTLAVMVPVAEALGAAHAKGLVHRDLKPENIFLSGNRDVLIPKILDFGISKVTKAGEVAGEAEGRLIVGSPTYMSPEQIRAPAEVDQRTDVWAVGVILYECLAGRRPFDAASVADLFVQICRDDPPPIDDYVHDLPRALRDLIMGCLNRRADRRPQDGAVLARALHRVSSRLSGVLSVPGTISSRPPVPVVVGGRRSERPLPSKAMEPTAPDLSEYGAFQVPDELRLDFGELGAHDNPESIANAVAQVAASRPSNPGAFPAAGGVGHVPTRPSRPLDIDPRDLAPPAGRRKTTSGTATPATGKGRHPAAPAREAVRPGRPPRTPDVPSLGSMLGAAAWLGLSAASVAVFAGEALPARVQSLGPLAGFGLLALVMGLGAVAIGVGLRTVGSPGYTLGVVGLGGVGITVVTLLLGLRHFLPNLPGIRDNHALFVLAGAAAVAVLALGLGLRGLFGGVDAFRVRPRRPLLGTSVLLVSLALGGSAGWVFYALGTGHPLVPRAIAPALAPLEGTADGSRDGEDAQPAAPAEAEDVEPETSDDAGDSEPQTPAEDDPGADAVRGGAPTGPTGAREPTRHLDGRPGTHARGGGPMERAGSARAFPA
ncbi:MAG: serine/threonine protein kinase [Sandaracinaceae bacterium]|nr:serine/threonine protein kinase [Sandaracinaceae bacterium]